MYLLRFFFSVGCKTALVMHRVKAKLILAMAWEISMLIRSCCLGSIRANPFIDSKRMDEPCDNRRRARPFPPNHYHIGRNRVSTSFLLWRLRHYGCVTRSERIQNYWSIPLLAHNSTEIGSSPTRQVVARASSNPLALYKAAFLSVKNYWTMEAFAGPFAIQRGTAAGRRRFSLISRLIIVLWLVSLHRY